MSKLIKDLTTNNISYLEKVIHQDGVTDCKAKCEECLLTAFESYPHIHDDLRCTCSRKNAEIQAKLLLREHSEAIDKILLD